MITSLDDRQDEPKYYDLAVGSLVDQSCRIRPECLQDLHEVLWSRGVPRRAGLRRAAPAQHLVLLHGQLVADQRQLALYLVCA